MRVLDPNGGRLGSDSTPIPRGDSHGNKRWRSRSRRFITTVHKPHGIIKPRVQQVGPERFGIVSVDCAKARFKWMLCDFYGNVLVPPTVVEHNRVELELALAQLDNLRTPHLAS